MMKKIVILWGVAALFLFTAGFSRIHAAEFSADMVQTKDGETSISGLFVKQSKYRMEMKQEGRKYAVIVDRETGTTTLLSPEEKQYMKLKNASFRSMTSNPFESFWYHAQTYERQEIGEADVSGFTCRKVRVRSGDRNLFTGWISEKLDFPLKIVFHVGKGVSMKLENIRQGPVEAALFDIPGDFTEKEKPKARSAKKKKMPAGPEKKPWMNTIGSAEVLDPPVDKDDMAEGEIIRIKIEKGKALDTFTSDSILLYAFKQGEPVVKFKNKNRRKICLSPQEADEIVLYNPAKSRFSSPARVKQGDMPERMLGAGEQKRTSMQPGVDYVCRFINTGGSEAVLYYTWRLYGKDLPESKIGPKSFRTIHLPPWKNFRSTHNQMRGEAPGETLLVQIKKGRVLVKAGQPFPQKTANDSMQKSLKKETSAAAAESAEPALKEKGSSRAMNIMFILDASGSMWGEVEGRDKIAIAKDVMAELVRDLPDNTRAGLVAYGHRRKGDCKDLEELVQMSSLDKEGLIRIIQGLSPKGKTPISHSVRLTAEKLKVLEDETTIILVSDGKESCGGDPCPLVKELKESGLRFVMHVIGFDVTEQEREQLECMAEAGGGRYFTAKTAGEFEAAAREVVQETKTAGFLEVMAFRNETPVRASVEVLTQDTGQRVRKVNTAMDEKKPAVIRLKPGTYTVVFTDGELPGNPGRSFSDVTIELDQTVRKTARFEAGILELKAIKEGKSIHAHARLYKQDEMAASGWLKEGKGGTFSLLPGVYRVEVTDKSIPEEPVVSLKDIEIKSGQRISRQANFSREGELKIEALRAGKSIHVHAEVYKGDDRVASGWLEEGKGASFKLLPGVYRVEVEDKKIPQKPVVVLEDIEIEPGRTVSKQAQFVREGQLRIEAFKAGKSIHVHAEVYKGNERVTSSWLEEGRGASFKLLPGVYRAEIQDKKIPQKPVVVLEDIEIEPGQTVSKQAQFVREGQLSIEAFKAGKSIHVYVRVYKEDKQVAYGWLEEGKGRTFKLLPGSYRVGVKGPDDQVNEQKGIGIQSGQTTSVDIRF